MSHASVLSGFHSSEIVEYEKIHPYLDSFSSPEIVNYSVVLDKVLFGVSFYIPTARTSAFRLLCHMVIICG